MIEMELKTAKNMGYDVLILMSRRWRNIYEKKE